MYVCVCLCIFRILSLMIAYPRNGQSPNTTDSVYATLAQEQVLYHRYLASSIYKYSKLSLSLAFSLYIYIQKSSMKYE